MGGYPQAVRTDDGRVLMNRRRGEWLQAELVVARGWRFFRRLWHFTVLADGLSFLVRSRKGRQCNINGKCAA